MKCNCGRREEDGMVWNPANREETMQHACMSGTVTPRGNAGARTPLFERATVDCDVGSRSKTASCDLFGEWKNMNSTCFCPADGVFPAGREVSHVLGGLLPATSLLHGRVPPSRSGQCRVDGQAVLGVHDATSEFIRCVWWRRADLLPHRIGLSLGLGLGLGLGDDPSPRRAGLLRGSLRRVQSRPASLDRFLSNGARSFTVVSGTDPALFLFAYDVAGALIGSDLVYQAWCAVGRDVCTIQADLAVGW